MKKGQWFGILLMLLLVSSAAPLSPSQAQPQRRDSAEEKSKASGGAAAKQQSSASNEETPSAAAGVRTGTKISAALESSVDTRTAKPGDEVVARVTKNVKQDGKTIIHKGDRLIGRVQSVQANAAGDAGSHLAIAFDRLAHGEATTELHTVVSSILSTPGQQQQEPMAGPEPAAGSAPAASSSRSGGGLLGGVSSTVGSAVNAAGSVAGSAGPATSDTVGATLGSTLGASNNTGATLATPARGIHLDSQAQGQNQTSGSSVLSTRHGQLRLDSGTEMQFRVAAQAERQPNKP